MALTMTDQTRNDELGDFLRTRRERLKPEDVGFPAGGRRRTPGLRREEVAVLAGVSVTWYTWLEQGREAQPSSEVLLSLAEALQLNTTERVHLFNLVETYQPGTDVDDYALVPDAVLYQLMDQQGINPTKIVTPRGDVVAWNGTAQLLIPALKTTQPPYRNMVWITFTDPSAPQLIEDWDYHARSVLMQFRADYGQYRRRYDFESLIDELQIESAAFRKWWAAHDVRFRYAVEKRIKHPTRGDLAFTVMSLPILGSDVGLRMDTMLPVPGTDTAEKLRALLEETS